MLGVGTFCFAMATWRTNGRRNSSTPAETTSSSGGTAITCRIGKAYLTGIKKGTLTINVYNRQDLAMKTKLVTVDLEILSGEPVFWHMQIS